MKTQIFSPSGGTGCSTLTAFLIARLSDTNRVLTVDCHGDLHDMFSIDAQPGQLTKYSPTMSVLHGAGMDRETVAGVIAEHTAQYEHIVIDRGSAPLLENVPVVGVATNCYLNLRKWSRTNTTRSVDHFVFRIQHDRPLRLLDVETTIGCTPTAIIPFDMTIARNVDAGLITNKTPKALIDPINQLVAALTKDTADD